MKETVGSHGHNGVWAGTQHTTPACHQGILMARRYGLTSKCPREKSKAKPLGVMEDISGQIIATSHDLTRNGSLVREIPLFQVGEILFGQIYGCFLK